MELERTQRTKTFLSNLQDRRTSKQMVRHEEKLEADSFIRKKKTEEETV